MTPAQHLSAIQGAQRKVSAAAKACADLETKIARHEASIAELQGLENPNRKQLDELVRLDRALPFLAPQLESLQRQHREEVSALAETISAAWGMAEATINSNEAVALQHAAQAVLPWCRSLDQARGYAEQLPEIVRLNHLMRELSNQVELGQFADVASGLIEIFSSAAKSSKRTSAVRS